MVNPGYPSDHLQRFIAETGAPARALELGCGAGANLEWLCRNVPRPVGGHDLGIERDEALADFARRRLAGNADIITADMTAGLPCSAEMFELVFDIEAIYQNDMPAIKAIIPEVRRVLKPGGWFFGQMMRSAYASDRPDWSVGWRFSYSELRTLFRDFEALEIDEAMRTSGNGSRRLKEWLVRARKPA